MSQSLKKQLDPEIDVILIKLFKKGMDSNVFITEEVTKALKAISSNSSETKLLPVLF